MSSAKFYERIMHVVLVVLVSYLSTMEKTPRLLPLIFSFCFCKLFVVIVMSDFYKVTAKRVQKQ